MEANREQMREAIEHAREALEMIGNADQMPGHANYRSKRDMAAQARATLADMECSLKGRAIPMLESLRPTPAQEAQ